MKRYWPLLLLSIVWAVVLAVPRTRDYARAIGEQWAFSGDNNMFIYFRLVSYPEKYQRQLERFPGNKDILIAIAFDSAGPTDRNLLQKLAAQFPNDPLPIGVQLHKCFPNLYHNRAEGPLTNSNYPAKAPNRPLLSAAEKRRFLKYIELAKQGQRLDPNNTYFDWHLLYGLFALRRDQEALKVLEAASRKTGYDDFELRTRKARYNARSLDRALTPGEASQLWFSDPASSVNRMRESCRLVMERAIAARQRGDGAIAVSYSYYLMKMGRVARLESTDLMDSLVARAVEGLAIFNVQPPVPAVRRGRSATLSRTDNLAGLASASLQPGIAREVLAEWREVQKWRAVKWPFREFSFGAPISLFSGARLLEQGVRFILAATLWIFPLWLMLSALIALRRFRRHSEPVRTARGAVWGGVLGIISLVVLLTADVVLGLRGNNVAWSDFFTEYYASSGLSSHASWWIAGVPIVLLIWLALMMAVRWQQRQIPSPASAQDELAKLGADNRLNATMQQVFPGLAQISLILAAVVFMILYFGFVPVSGENYNYSKILLLVPAVCLWGSPLVSLFRRPRKLVTFQFAVRALRQVAAGYLIVMWFCLGLAILASLPGLQYFDVQFQRTLEEGEMPLLKKMVGL